MDTRLRRLALLGLLVVSCGVALTWTTTGRSLLATTGLASSSRARAAEDRVRADLTQRLQAIDSDWGKPVFVRIFKREKQLEVWAQRSDVDMIRQQAGSDPSAVLYDALQAAQARNSTLVIVDTAGRLHNKVHLMAELEKMTRTARRIVPDSPHEVWLVLDATTGQNGLEQAKKFTESAGVTGIVLTKLDGTAKGGVVVAIAREMNLPIRFIGVGEQIEDLVPFEADKFVASLFDN